MRTQGQGGEKRVTEVKHSDTLEMMSQEPKQKIFIYDRREVAVLILLGVMVAVFSFTLGVHLGKKVDEASAPNLAKKDTQTLPAETIDDTVPSRLEMSEEAKEVQGAIDDSLNQVLHDEVARTGVQLEKYTPTKLPSQTQSKNQGATTGPRSEDQVKKEAKPADGVKKAILIHRPAPQGKYTLQVGSFPSATEALDKLQKLEKKGEKTVFVREAKIEGRGKWYRVYLGGFPSKQEADKIAKKYLSTKVISNYIVANMPDDE